MVFDSNDDVLLVMIQVDSSVMLVGTRRLNRCFAPVYNF